MIVQFRLYLIMVGIAIFSLLFSAMMGSTQLLWNMNPEQLHTILFELRLPRTFTAFASGGLLALAGALMQVLLQNPLADPYILGISGGAAFVTLLLMLLGVSSYWLMSGAWLGSMLAIGAVLLLARRHRFHAHALLLFGVAIASGFSAAISFILIISPATSLHNMLFWLMGDLNEAPFPTFLLSILVVGLLISLALAPGLNILIRGESEARALGLATSRYRAALFLLSSFFTATAVTFVGCIGFIGLIVPHLTRQLIGYDHRILLPCSMMLGGSLLTIADSLARTIFAPQQLPAGIFMALIGVPFFIWLLQR